GEPLVGDDQRALHAALVQVVGDKGSGPDAEVDRGGKGEARDRHEGSFGNETPRSTAIGPIRSSVASSAGSRTKRPPAKAREFTAMASKLARLLGTSSIQLRATRRL